MHAAVEEDPSDVIIVHGMKLHQNYYDEIVTDITKVLAQYTCIHKHHDRHPAWLDLWLIYHALGGQEINYLYNNKTHSFSTSCSL